MKEVLVFFLFGIFLSACHNPSNPDIKFNSDSIEILNFPDILLGRTGVGSIDWSKGFNFSKLNRKIYNRVTGRGLAKLLIDYDDSDVDVKYIFAKSFSKTNIDIYIYLERVDRYGDKRHEKLFLGQIDTYEYKKYKDYSKWLRHNDFEEQARSRLIEYWNNKP
ncbi:MAG: hypothetical protein Q8P34_16180 [Bacteroidota bacterium]|nr:hypothetical protein [Bacteroidota bacterium]